MMKATCKDTHRFVLTGICPWCGNQMAYGQFAQGSLATRPQRRWNIPALIDALQNQDSRTRIMVISNMMFDGSHGEDILQVLRVGLANDCPDVTQHATMALVHFGQELVAFEPEGFEKSLAGNSGDLCLRIVLLSHYFGKELSEIEMKRRQAHVFWIIEHAPASPFAGMPQVTFDPRVETEAYEKAKRSWQEIVETNQDNARVLANAAAFFAFHDKELAKDYLEKAKGLEPENPEWPEKLAHQVKRDFVGDDGIDHETRVFLASKSLAELETAFNYKSERREKYWLLPNLAQAAFAANDFDKARSYATQLLKESSDKDNPFANDANAVHVGNLVLGRLALASGNPEVAKKHLIESANCSGTPNLISFGPSMRLARDLLEIGERDIVVEYLKLCSKFWATNNHQPEQWIHAIEKGGIPDFGPNLNY